MGIGWISWGGMGILRTLRIFHVLDTASSTAPYVASGWTSFRKTNLFYLFRNHELKLPRTLCSGGRERPKAADSSFYLGPPLLPAPSF